MSHEECDAKLGLEGTEVLPPTRLIGGKYRLGRLLGEGGMGAVYQAEHTGLGTVVAVKLLNESFATDKNALSRFRREARAAAAIRHENIVSVFDTGTDDRGIPFIVMEMLEGESLSAYLRREGVLRPEVATAVTLQILAGLAAAHDKRVVHRDLKPGNIIVACREDNSQVVKVLDFGISKFYSDPAVPDVTATGAVIGTPRFMAPEQARGERDIDERVDLYAVGVLLYRMVTGKLPFGGTTQREIIDRILEGNPTMPREIDPSIPKPLEAAILRALEVDKANRQQSAREMSVELTHAMPEITRGTPIPIDVVPTGAATFPTVHPSANSIPSLIAASPSGMATRAESSGAKRREQQLQRKRAITRMASIGLAVVILGAVLVVAISRQRNGASGNGMVADPFQAGAQYEGKPVRFGITRYLPKKGLGEEHASLLRYLAKKLKRPVKLEVLDGYVNLAEKLSRGEIEFAALASYAYVRAVRKKPGLRLIATHVTSSGTSYDGFIVSRADSNFRTIHDLKDKVFCYVSHTSTSGYLYPRGEFRANGMDPDTAFRATRFTGDHLTALRTLYDGACDGAAVFAGMLYEAQKHGMAPEKFKILLSTRRIPYDAYCVSDTVSEKLAGEIKDALLSLAPGSAVAKRVLGKKSRLRGFAPAQDKDYDPVRKIEKFLDKAGKKGKRPTFNNAP
ncbi:MAG: phosphate/phosphite/phosphonate ABC transporter substrate-binding protein [Deltaproteobacteria bacterium]|nr:phosphate/phosphite/phosphonate ABC transporter substrate-binding protein [Deltaproteobacteria bacterium]